MEILECNGKVTLTIPEPHYGWTKCDFQGVKIYSVIIRLFNLNQEIFRMEQDNTFKGWLKYYNIKYLYSNPIYVERAFQDIDRFNVEIIYIEKEMKIAFDGIYDDFTFNEWIETFVGPIKNKITSLVEARDKLLEIKQWPKRPLL